MKHYRLLNEGDPVEKGDEWLMNGGKWMPVAPNQIGHQDGRQGDAPCIFKRPLGSETCDHVIGYSATHRSSGLLQLSDFPGSKLEEIWMDRNFNFCPLCGIPLGEGEE